MTSLLRRFVAGGSAALVPVGAVCAMFVHAHLDDHDTFHHRGPQVHSHFSEHPTASTHHDGSTTTIENDDTEEPVDLQVFVAVSSYAQVVPAPPIAPYALVTRSTPAPRPMRQVTHGKDPPPSLANLGPRPPPTASF